MSQRRRDQLLRLIDQDPDLLDRCLVLAERPPRQIEDDAACLVTVFRPLLAGYREERCAVAAVDNRNRLLGAEVLSVGSHRAVLIDTQQVLRWVLTQRQPASAFAIAHNHPSGSAEPSPQDERLTRDLVRAARAVGLDLMDHLILTSGTAWYSFVDAGHEAIDPPAPRVRNRRTEERVKRAPSSEIIRRRSA